MYILCLKSSHTMGMGHLFRMMNLYQALLQVGSEAVFVILDKHMPTQKLLMNSGLVYEVVDDEINGWEARLIEKYQPAVWINDRLETDEKHVISLKSEGIKLVTFDDGGSGAKFADIHIAALANARGDNPEGRCVLKGIEYLILPQEISQHQRLRTTVNKLVVNLGGSDTHGMTVKVIDYLVKKQRPATVILGPGYMHEADLKKIISSDIIIKRAVPSLVAEFSNYDMAITGGGLTAFEAAAAGLPTLTIANEQHEIGHCKYLEELGCSEYAGYLEKADLTRLENMFDIQKMSLSGIDSVTLSGVKNICQLISALI